MKKRILSMLLVLAMLAVLAPAFPAQATEAAAVGAVDIQDGLTLHCWNWSYSNIQQRMADIAAMGYTAIQTSPIQQAKQATAGYPTNDWWVYYQPAGFAIDDSGSSALGTKSEFIAMCETAHQYGIAVIVDVVANHMGNAEDGSNGLASTIVSDLKNDSSCWHDLNKNISDYSSRQDVTQSCMSGLPDLNTANEKVQTCVLNFLKECIDAGADGFRFDAAKHIETPDDNSSIASNFWPTVIHGATDYAKTSRDIDLYCYGELLDNPGGNLGYDAYTKYMHITDNTASYNVLYNVASGVSALSPSYTAGTADQVVLWAESHDNFADGSTADVSEEVINKTWALVAARADAMSLYLARPANMSQLLGAASVTGWSYPEVVAVNHFHNHFAGQSEYIANESGVSYVERGDSGVVLVNCAGTAADISVTAHTMADGTYTDQLTGNTFTVSGSKITGSIGDTGIAVVYTKDACAHETHDSEGLCTQCRANVGHSYGSDGTCACGAVQVGQRTLYVSNSTNWSSVNFYSWYDDVNIISDAWPGNAMTSEGDGIYSCIVPLDAPNIIFNNGSDQTADLTVPEDKNLYDLATGQWSVYGESEPEVTEPEATVPEATEPQTTQPADDTAPGDDNLGNFSVILSAICAVLAVAILVIVVIQSKKKK